MGKTEKTADGERVEVVGKSGDAATKPLAKAYAFFGITFQLPSFGLAFAFCWIYCIQRVFATEHSVLFPPAVFAGTAAICLAAAAMAMKLKHTCSASKSARAVVSLCAALAVCVYGFMGAHASAEGVTLLAGLFFGAIAGWLYLTWGSFYGKLPINAAIGCLFGSAIVASVLKLIILFAPYPWVAQTICASLPILSTWCLSRVEKTCEGKRGDTARFKRGGMYPLKPMAIGVAIFSLAIGALRSADMAFFMQPFLSEVFAHVLEVLIFCYVLYAVYRHPEDFSLSRMWFIVLLAIVTALLVGQINQTFAGTISNAILAAAQMLALVLLWLGLSDVSHNSQFESDIVFGVGWSLYALPVALGSFLICAFGGSLYHSAFPQIVTYVLMLALFFFMQDRPARPVRLLLDLTPPATSAESADFAEKVDAVAREYTLSDREKEIIELYAQGRSRTYISDNLFISENTVRDHVKHAYRKMHIHNKQELIDLIHHV